MTGSSGLSRPSSGQGHREERASKDMDESLGGDESMALSSPTTHVHPGHKKSASASVKETTEQELDQDGNDVSMDEGILDEEEANQLTSKMNADERRAKLRRRTSRKNERSDAEEGTSS